MQTSSLIIITLCVAATLTLSAVTKKIIKHYDSDKGARVTALGVLDQQKWATNEGVQRSSFQLIANTIEFIKTDGRDFEEGQNNEDVPF